MASEEALRAILALPKKTGVLSTIRRDGRPQMSVVMHHYDPQTGALRISVTDDRAKTRNLRRDPRATYLVQGQTRWQFVVAEGEAVLGAVVTEPDSPAADDLVSYYRDLAGEHPDWDKYRNSLVEQKRLLLTIPVSRVYGLA